jgi:PAS domain S-box-containing protein
LLSSGCNERGRCCPAVISGWRIGESSAKHGEDILKTLHKMTFWLGGAALLSALMMAAMFHLLGQSEAATEWQSHTLLVLNAAENFLSDMENAESGQRGYLLTGDETYLAPYLKALSDIPGHLAKMRQLTQDNIVQQHRLDAVHMLVDTTLSEFSQTITLRRNQGTEKLQHLLHSSLGKTTMELIRVRMHDFKQMESDLLVQREAEVRATQHRFVVLITAIALLVVFIAMVSAYLIYRETQRRLRLQEASGKVLEAAYDATRASEENLSVTLNSIGDAVMATDANGRVTRLNTIAEQLTGWPQTDALGQPVEEVFHVINQQTREAAPIPVGITLTQGIIHGLANDTVLIARDGSERMIADSCAPIKNHNGIVSGAVLVFRDVSREYAVQKALSDSEKRYRTLFESIDEGFCIVEMLYDEHGKANDYRFVEINPAFVQQTGLEQALGKTIREMVPNHEAHWFEIYGRIAQTGVAMRFENPALAMQRHYEVFAFRIGGDESRQVGILFKDITEEKRAEQALHDSAMRIQTILNTVADGIITISEFGLVEMVNPAVEQLFGYAADEVVGQNISLLIPEPYHSQHDGYLERYRATGEAHVVGIGREVEGRRKDGCVFPMYLAVSEMRLDGRRYFTGIVHDLTGSKQAEELLHLAKEKAENANHAKDAFLATMSHEIRTPLAGMLGMLEVLSLTPLNQDQQETMEAAWESGRSLLRIVSDILDWSKIEEGKLHLTPQAASIPHLLKEVINTYSRVASAKSLLLRQHVDVRLSAAHIVDALRLSQVLNNFVSNAIKFTHSGEIVLSAELLETLDSGERIRFAVRDTGIGIAKDAQRYLFRRYQQESVHTTRMYGGTGLGLAICQSLVDLMDGQIELISEPGQGSTFRITLTLPVSGAPEEMVLSQHFEVQQRAVQPLFAEGMESPRVLVVDDHPINRDLLSRQLKLLGLRSDTAENGGDALLKWREGQFALVITDCHMPEMDGYALSRAIRKIEGEKKFQRMSIVAWTANALPEEVALCRASGMDDLLIKPVNLTQLKKMLEKHLCIEATGSSLDVALQGNTEGELLAGPIDYAVLEQIEPDSVAQFQVLQDFQTHIRADQARLLDMLKHGEQNSVHSMAHRMKGASRMVGAMELANACAVIEQLTQAGDMAGAAISGEAVDAVIRRLEDFLMEEKRQQGGQINAGELHFLVVEDDDFQRRMIVNMLRSLGVRLIGEAEHGKQAIEMIQRAHQTPVDVVLCDLNMPEMDGLEFLRYFGENHHQISIVIISALGNKLLASAGSMTKMYGMKLLGLIEKPVALGKLKEVLAKYESRANTSPPPAEAARFTMEEILRGIRAKQFEPYFQPKLDLQTGRITGAEVLARWIHPEHGVVSPYAFIPLLERSGNIDELTFVMLETAAAACRLLHDKGNMLSVSVNLSLVSLNDTVLADRITNVVKQAGLEPRYIILEVTETAAMTDVAHALENLTRLCMNGFGLSIDDYGTGYSSMQQLTRIPFSELKIDQSFVKDFVDNEALRIVVESSIEMAHKLKVKSVAEGVETQQDWDMLKSMGCDTAQGYFIARPMNLAAFVAYCAAGSCLA